MKNSSEVRGFLNRNFLLILGSMGINFFISCSSSETPTQSNEGPSEIIGTYFEAPLEYSAGENPVDIVFGDFIFDIAVIVEIRISILFYNKIKNSFSNL